MILRATALAAAALALAGCGRVPEQALRDEQARTRKYRDAYETLLFENGELKKRAQQAASQCPPSPAAAAPR